MQQIGKVKMLDKWVPHELTANQKDDCFEVSSSLILHNEPLLHWTVICDKVGFIQLATPAQWMDWAAPPKRFSRPHLYQKRSWSLSDGLLPAWSTPAFWIPVKPLPLRSKLSTLMRCTKNCSQHWSTKWAQFSMKMPDCTSYNQCFKSWTNWAMKLCLICYIHLASRQPTTTSSSISTTFCRENASAARRRQKILRVCQILKHGFLHYRNEQIYFSLAKMYWL